MSLVWRSEQRSSVTEHLSERRARRTSSVSTSPEQALRIGAVWSCTDLISRISALPVDQLSRGSDGVAVEVKPSNLFVTPWPDANGHSSPIGWRRQIVMSWLTRGNAFLLVAARDRLGYPTVAQVLDPGKMRAKINQATGQLEWLYNGKFYGNDLIHHPAFTVPGSEIGLAPLEYAAVMTGLGYSAQDFGAKWFVDGAHPSAILSTDQQVTPEQAATIKSRFLAAIRGREPAVLGAGIDYTPVQVSAEESQFLATIKANKADIAGFFLVPPEMIGGEAGNSMTYGNVASRGLHFLTYTAGYWITLLEELLSSLVPPGEYVKLNSNAYVRMDPKGQAELEAIRIRGGWGTPDEARAHEDLPPLPNGVGAQSLWPPLGAGVAQVQEPDDDPDDPNEDDSPNEN